MSASCQEEKLAVKLAITSDKEDKIPFVNKYKSKKQIIIIFWLYA